ncbi:DUF6245 family protein [Kitasatospora sp. NPDC096147]|uniref:DUF6245 family protein n=1 Tax=Kitasatospora sp. NPDC096147 TaxID=3364093 RepID=UPI003812955F
MTDDGPPVTVEQIAAALAALDYYDGENTPQAHARYAAGYPDPEAYRAALLNALLGSVQAEAMLTDMTDLPDQDRERSWMQQISSAGAAEDDLRQITFVTWQLWRASFPLSVFARSDAAGPVAIAAAYTAEAAQALTNAMSAGWDALASGDFASIDAQQQMMLHARDRLRAALGHVEDHLAVVERDEP